MPALPPWQTRHALSQDSALCLRRASIFSLCDGPAFAEVDYVVCFPDDILFRLSLMGLSAGWDGCLPEGNTAHPGAGGSERPCWGAGGIHTPQGKEDSEYVFHFQGLFKKSLSNPGLNSACSGGNLFCTREGLHHQSILHSMHGWTG